MEEATGGAIDSNAFDEVLQHIKKRQEGWAWKHNVFIASCVVVIVFWGHKASEVNPSNVEIVIVYKATSSGVKTYKKLEIQIM